MQRRTTRKPRKSTLGRNKQPFSFPNHTIRAQKVPNPQTTDEELMRRAQEGDQPAFAVLYERYTLAVLSYLCRLLGSREDAESVGQDVFVRAMRFAPTYRYPRKFSAWLFTITRNLAINNTRRRTRSPVRTSAELNMGSVEHFVDRHQLGTPTADEMEKREELSRAMRAMDGLPADQREVIALGIFQNLSYGQMEEILGTKAVTLRSRMFHGLRNLATVMSHEHPADGPSLNNAKSPIN
jgi:RNA polymerase sigma-70 factor (ECF subfamily)